MPSNAGESDCDVGKCLGRVLSANGAISAAFVLANQKVYLSFDSKRTAPFDPAVDWAAFCFPGQQNTSVADLPCDGTYSGNTAEVEDLVDYYNIRPLGYYMPLLWMNGFTGKLTAPAEVNSVVNLTLTQATDCAFFIVLQADENGECLPRNAIAISNLAGNWKQLSFNAQAGQTYCVVVETYPIAPQADCEGPFTLSISETFDCAPKTRCGCECKDTSTDVDNCGGCGTKCVHANATSACENSQCTFQCNSGFADCDFDPSNGCEVDLNNDPLNCRSCDTICGTSRPVCVNGTCAATCPLGKTLCAGQCVDVTNNIDHCGACNNRCEVENGTPVCTASTCAIDSCNTGYDDCDSIAGTGCETPVTTITDCGGCGNICSFSHGEALCTDSECKLGKCDSGYGNCDQDVEGCETTLGTEENCTACGDACGGNASCGAQGCACDAGFADCEASPDGICETTLGTVANCSDCGDACEFPHAVAACTAGECTMGACEAGFEDCDHNEANGCETALDNRNNCGACGTICLTLQNCVASGNTFACSNTCHDIDDDGFADATCGGSDCNDSLSTINPDATEICDNVDNNCNGRLDEGFDKDKDGYKTCGAETDCDDNNPRVHPGAADICNDGIDQDCVGGDNTNCDCQDADKDGYTDKDCGGTDCDDTSAAIHPGAKELCDKIDNNCDGVTDVDPDGNDACYSSQACATASDDFTGLAFLAGLLVLLRRKRS